MEIQKIASVLNIAVYLISFFVEIKKVCSSSSGCNAQFHLFNKCGVGPGIHINQQIRSILVEAKIWVAKQKILIFANNVRFDYFPLFYCSYIWRTIPYCFSLVIWAKSVEPNLTFARYSKFYGELFDVHVFLNLERNCQSVAFNPLATHCLVHG